MRDRRQHARPVFDQAAQPGLHGVERARGLTCLDRASLRHRWSIQVIAEPFGSCRHCGKRRCHAAHGPYRDRENNDRHNPHRKQELARKVRAALRQGGREGKPLAIGQRDRDLQIAEAAESDRSRAIRASSDLAPSSDVGPPNSGRVRRRCRHARLLARRQRKLIDKKFLNRLSNRPFLVVRDQCRRLGRE